MHFYGITGSILGTYEAVAKLTGRVPTVSTWTARHRIRRLAMVLWTLGLVAHIARHEAD